MVVAVEVGDDVTGAAGAGVVDAAETVVESAGAYEDADAGGGGGEDVGDAVAVEVGYGDEVAAVAGEAVGGSGAYLGGGAEAAVGVAMVDIEASVGAFCDEVWATVAVHVGEQGAEDLAASSVGCGVSRTVKRGGEEGVRGGAGRRDEVVGDAVAVEVGGLQLACAVGTEERLVRAEAIEGVDAEGVGGVDGEEEVGLTGDSGGGDEGDDVGDVCRAQRDVAKDGGREGAVAFAVGEVGGDEPALNRDPGDVYVGVADGVGRVGVGG